MPRSTATTRHTPPTTSAKPRRHRLIAKVKIGQKQLSWDDDLYRSVLARRYQKHSATELRELELVDLIEHMKSLGARYTAPRAGRRKLARGEVQGKIRALWISLYHLGVVRNPSESALAAFVKRQAQVEALEWINARKADRIIEGLKTMAARDGGVDWKAQANPRLCVLEAQGLRLAQLGIDEESVAYQLQGLADQSNPELDRRIALLGAALRDILAEGEAR